MQRVSKKHVSQRVTLPPNAESEHTSSADAGAFDDLAAAGERLGAVKANPPFQRLRVEFRSGEALDKKHRAATTWTPPQRGRTRFRRASIRRTGHGHSQQLLANRQQGFAPAVRQEAEKADTRKAMREHMQKKAAQKLFRRLLS